MPTDWKNKVVFVTGSSSGLGAATAVRYAQLGVKLAIHGRNEERLQGVAKQCLDAGLTEDKIVLVTGDVTNEADIRRTFQEVIDKFGDINVMVNNAGSGIFKPLLETSLAELANMQMIHVGSVLLYSQLSYPYLKKNKGNVVNMASIAGSFYLTNLGAYCTAKAGENQITKGLAMEWAADGVRVNSVCPGWCKTGILDHLGLGQEKTDELWDFLDSIVPLGSVHPDAIADAVVHISSDEAAYTTGQTYTVDGGTTLKLSATLELDAWVKKGAGKK